MRAIPNPGGCRNLPRAASKGGLPAWIALVACVGLGAGAAHADRLAGASLAQQGGPGVTACVACHGARGEGQPAAGFPRLAGQSKAYLLKQLQEFANGKRKNPQMEPIARALSAQQMRDAVDYYASLPGWEAGAKATASAPQSLLGSRLAIRGNWNKDIPACFACHGPDGAGIPPHFPALTGQPSAYTRAQLKAWRAGTRNNDPQGLMKAVADKMSDAEIEAVSLYFENPSFSARRE